MDSWERERDRLIWILKRVPAGVELPKIVDSMRRLGSDLTTTQICRRLDELIEVGRVALSRTVRGDRVIRKYRLLAVEERKENAA